MRGANDGLWDWNLDTNKIYYSPRWKSILGYGENELDDSLETWQKLIHADMVNDEKALLLIGSVIEMGHKLGYEVVVEGIETPEQLEIIKDLNCKNAQGFLFSKAVDTREILNLLNNSFAV